MKDLDFDKMKIVKLSEKIKHQGIGGKEFRIEKVGKMSYILDMDFKDMTFAARNFILRREDILQVSDDMTIYYGHCLHNNYGYFIAEDEIES